MNLKKIIALALVVCMVLSFFPVSVFAEEWDEEIVLTDEEYYEEPQEEYVEEIIEEEPADYVEYVEPVEEIVVEEPAEEPVVEEPAVEEPAVVEEPAAVEQSAAPAAAADLEAAEAFGATSNYMVGGDGYNTLAEAVDAAAAGGTILVLNTNSNAAASVNKNVTIKGTDPDAIQKITGLIRVSANVTFENVNTSQILAEGGILSIKNGEHDDVIASGATSGNVTGGKFGTDSAGSIEGGIDEILIADGYYASDMVTGVTPNRILTFDKDAHTSGTVTQLTTDVLNVYPVKIEFSDTKTCYYESLAGAVAAASADSTIELASNVTLTDTVTIDKAVTIDLGGKTITNNNADASKYAFSVTAGNVTFKNGTIAGTARGISAEGSTAVLTLGTNDAALTVNTTGRALGLYDGASAVLAAGSSLSTSINGDVTVFTSTNSTFDVYGTVTQTSTGESYDNNAISGNGSKGYEGTTLNIYEGAVVSSAKAVAIYLPQVGTTTISGGTVTGASGIGIKCGVLNITGGTITGNGAFASTTPFNNGINADGSAIIVENNNGYDEDNLKPTEINISGNAVLNSTNAFALNQCVKEGSSASELGKIEVTGGTFNGNVSKGVIQAVTTDKVAVSGGTFNAPVPENCCAEGYIPEKNDEGTYGVEPGTIAMRVVTLGETTGTGYDAKEVVKAVADAIAAYAKDKSKALYVISGTYSDVVIPNDAAMKIYCATGVSFSVTAADAEHYVEIKKVENGEIVDAIATKTSYILESKLYQATVTEEGKEPVPFANIYKAIESAIETGGVLKPLVKYNETTNYNYGIAIGETLNVDQSGDIKLDIVKREGVLCVINTSGEGTAKATYECVAAVASYKDADGETVYTTTFAKAAEEAAAVAAKAQPASTSYEVTLHARPTVTGENPDVYTMDVGTLTVFATPTDLLNDYDKLVDVEGEKVLTSERNTAVDPATATYTVVPAVARVDLNGVPPKYFSKVEDAVDFVTDEGHENLFIVPLAEGTFKVNATTGEPYVGKAIKVNNAGEFKIAFESTYAKDNVSYQFVEETGENYSTYQLKASIASVAFPDGLDEYYKPKFLNKYYDTFAKAAAAAEGTNVITLLAAPENYKEQYVVGETSVDEVLKVNPGDPAKTWLTVKAVDDYTLAKVTDKDTKVTTYSIQKAVASITVGTKTTYYDSFKKAADTADFAPEDVADAKTVVLLADITEKYTLEDGMWLNVEKGDWTVDIVPANTTVPKWHAIDDSTVAGGVTTFQSVLAEASVGTGTDTVFYASFEDAAEAAAGQTVTTYPDYNSTTTKYVARNLTYSLSENESLSVNHHKEGSIVNKLTVTTEVSGKAVHSVTEATVTTYTLVAAVASITDGGVTTGYETFEKAVAVAGKAGAKTIKLLDDITTEFKFEATNEVLSIDLNGNTLDTIGIDQTSVGSGEKNGYVVMETATQTATIYSVTAAQARIGDVEDGDYYETLAEAAVDAAGTETVVLLNSNDDTTKPSKYEYELTADVNKLNVYKNGQTLTVTSGVAGQAVKETKTTVGGNVVNVYELAQPVASIGEGEDIQYFSTFAEAAAKGSAALTVEPKTITLYADAGEYTLAVGKQITVNNPDGKALSVKPGNWKSGDTKDIPGMLIVDEETGNYKAVQPAAAINYDKDDEKLYETFADAALDGFNAPSVEFDDALVITVLKQELDTEDVFEVEEAGYFVFDSSISGHDAAHENVTVDEDDGIFAAEPEKIKDNIWRVDYTAAEAAIFNNNQKFDYYPTVADAVTAQMTATNPERFPVVILAEGLSYQLAFNENDGAKNVIYVDKNGNDDFVVTKENPATLTPAIAIIEEEMNDGVTKYTATKTVAAYIDFTSEKDTGAYTTETVDNYVYFSTFNDAVSAAGGEKTIVLAAERALIPAGQFYTLSSGETLIVDVTADDDFVTDVVRPPVGYMIIDDAVVNKVHTLTVSKAVATVTTGADTQEFEELGEAVQVAINNNPDGAVLKLLAEVPEDFTYSFSVLDKLTVSNEAGYSMFADGNLTAPEGMYVKGTEDKENHVVNYEVVEILATVAYEEDGETVTAYFDEFIPAVVLVKDIENDKLYNDETKDVKNPTTPITLWKNNGTQFKFSAPETTDAVQSLRVVTNGFDPNFDASDNAHFIEAVATTFGGPVQFKNSLLVAKIDNSLVWEEPGTVVAEYSSFSAAATDAMENGTMVEIVVTDPKLVDAFEMHNGLLRVKGNDGVKLDTFVANRKVIPVGDMAVLSYRADEDEHGEKQNQGTFTVSGTEAMIIYQDQTTAPRYFTTFLDAVIEQDGNANLPIIPLTDISTTYTATDLTITPEIGILHMINEIYVDPSADYDVDVKVEEYEVVKDETYTASDKYDIKEAVCYVETDKIVGYNTDNSPIYERVYFADIGRASKFAANTKVIHVTATAGAGSYTLGAEDVNEVLNLYFDVGAGVAITLTSGQEGYGVKDATPTELGERARVYKLVGKVTVTVNAGNGEFADHSKTKEIITDIPGATISADNYQLSDAPRISGYDFAYLTDEAGNMYVWSTTSTTATYLPLPTVVPEEDQEITAQFAAKNYNVVYNGKQPEGDPTTETKTVAYDVAIPAPTAPSALAHYTFDGWFLDEAYTKPFTPGSIALKDITDATVFNPDTSAALNVYGKWTVKTYTVTFDTGCDVTVDPVTLAYGSKVTKPNDADWTKEGYTNPNPITWHYVNAGVNVPWNFAEDGVTADVKLIKDWTPKTMTIVWANESTVIRTDSKQQVGAKITPPDTSKLQKSGYRIDPDNAWVDFDGTVPYAESGSWIFQVNWIEQVQVSFVVDSELVKTIDVDKDSTLADNPEVPTPSEPGLMYNWTLKGEAYDLNTPVTATITLISSGSYDPTVTADMSYNMSIADSLNLKFYVRNVQDNYLDYKVTVSVEGEDDVVYTLDNAVDNVFTIAEFDARRMTDKVHVSVVDGDKEILSKDYTIAGYCDSLINSEGASQKLKDLANTILVYGANAQITLNYKTDNLPTNSYDVSGVVIPDATAKAKGTVEGVNRFGNQAMVETYVTLRILLQVEAGVDMSKYTITVNDDEVEAVQQSDTVYYVDVPISVLKLSERQILYVESDDGMATYTLSAITPMKRADNNLARATYAYFSAATDYATTL